MAIFKFVISEPSSRKSLQMEIDQSKTTGLIGKKIGDQFNADIIGMSGYTLEITGGTDKDGFPMHPGLKGTVRKKILLTQPPGFHPKRKGQRKRKMVRGNTISDDIVQINVKVVKVGDKPLEQFMTKKEEPKEVPKEEPKEAAKEQPKEKAKGETKKEPEKQPERAKEDKKEDVEEKPAEKGKSTENEKNVEGAKEGKENKKEAAETKK